MTAKFPNWITAMLRIYTLVLFIIFAGAPKATAADAEFDAKIKKIVADGQITKAILDSLTEDDVPQKWTTTQTTEDKGNRHLVYFYRGGRKALMVEWEADWTGKREKMFVACAYDGDKTIGRIAHTGESTSVFPVPAKSIGYSQIVELKDSGQLQVMILKDDAFLEVVEIDGRNTHLMDDLEYTKDALLMTDVIDPLVNTIKSGLSDHRK